MKRGSSYRERFFIFWEFSIIQGSEQAVSLSLQIMRYMQTLK